jgi:hypothetical protein
MPTWQGQHHSASYGHSALLSVNQSTPTCTVDVKRSLAFVATLVVGLATFTGTAATAGAQSAPVSNVVATYGGTNTNFGTFVHSFVVPNGYGFEVKWSLGQGDTWDVSRNSNVGSLSCDQTLFCGQVPWTVPVASGVHLFTTYGAGRFYMAITPFATWRAQVILIPLLYSSSGGGGGGRYTDFSDSATIPYGDTWTFHWCYQVVFGSAHSVPADFAWSVDTGVSEVGYGLGDSSPMPNTGCGSQTFPTGGEPSFAITGLNIDYQLAITA